MKFLGRTLDEKTMTYSYPGSTERPLPEEMRQEIYEAGSRYVKFKDGTYGGNGIFVLGKIWEWKKRLGIDAQRVVEGRDALPASRSNGKLYILRSDCKRN